MFIVLVLLASTLGLPVRDHVEIEREIDTFDLEPSLSPDVVEFGLEDLKKNMDLVYDFWPEIEREIERKIDYLYELAELV